MNPQRMKAPKRTIPLALVKYWENVGKAHETPAKGLESKATAKKSALKPNQRASAPKRTPSISSTVRLPAPLLAQEIEAQNGNGPKAATRKGVAGK